jgi:hypothetical protein
MTKYVEVRQQIKVTVDESRFTPEFLAAFKRAFFDAETVEDHIKHIAESYARGIVTFKGDFLEGYGKMDDFGISCKREDVECEVES